MILSQPLITQMRQCSRCGRLICLPPTPHNAGHLPYHLTSSGQGKHGTVKITDSKRVSLLQYCACDSITVQYLAADGHTAIATGAVVAPGGTCAVAGAANHTALVHRGNVAPVDRVAT